MSTSPATRLETTTSPASRPVSVIAVAKIQMRNRIHVGISDSALSWPRRARNSVNPPPTAPITRNEVRANVEARVDDGNGDKRELRDDPYREQHADEAMPEGDAQKHRQEDDEAGGDRGF